MREIVFLLGFFFKGPVILVIAAAKMMRRTQLVAAAPLKNAVATRKLAKATAKSASSSETSASAASAAVHDVAVEGPTVMAQTADFEVADRIISIRLVPPVGVLNMRVYQESKVIKRDLIIHEPRLRAIMRGRRFTFPDAPFDPKADLEGIKDETVQLAEKLINDVGNARVKAHKPPKDEFKAKADSPKQVDSAVKAVKAPVVQAPPVPQVHVTPQAPATAPRVNRQEQKPAANRVFAPQPTVGITYVGKLTQAGAHQVTPKGRDPYEVFQATIEMDNGAVLPLRGAELERELESAGCRIGERVAITPMGKVPVALSSGGEGSKNLYKVENLAETA